jgi:hypothetical protein
MPENKGASFWKEECSKLLKEVIAKQGWDVIYNRIRDLDFMQPEEQLVFSPENTQV